VQVDGRITPPFFNRHGFDVRVEQFHSFTQPLVTGNKDQRYMV
jgi:hypothetical protein